jgi:hypothetical protein
LFIHVTVPPTATLTGFGAYAVVVSLEDPLTIETVIDGAVGEGEAGGIDDDDPHASVKASRHSTGTIRTGTDATSSSNRPQTCCPSRPARGVAKSGCLPAQSWPDQLRDADSVYASR